jgi:hypothetical protein
MSGIIYIVYVNFIKIRLEEGSINDSIGLPIGIEHLLKVKGAQFLEVTVCSICTFNILY